MHPIEIRTKSLETTHLVHVAFGGNAGSRLAHRATEPHVSSLFVSWIGSDAASQHHENLFMVGDGPTGDCDCAFRLASPWNKYRPNPRAGQG